MTAKTVTSDADLAALTLLLGQRKRPFTVTIESGRNRSTEQNNLVFVWYGEIAEQSGESREDVRARCKLELGVPILRHGSEAFRKTYDRLIRPLDYADKLDLIRATDMPVTRLMNVGQMTEYMDEVFKRHTEFGIVLTIPPDRFAFDPERKRAA